MTTSTLPSTLLHAPAVGATSARVQPRAIGPVARWCATHFTRPLYHRLGAFDVARSGLASELLGMQTRR